MPKGNLACGLFCDAVEEREIYSRNTNHEDLSVKFYFREARFFLRARGLLPGKLRDYSNGPPDFSFEETITLWDNIPSIEILS